MTLSVNNIDISQYVVSTSYSVSRSPVQSQRITTLDGVDHLIVKRWRYTVSVELNPVTDDAAHAIYSSLTSAVPCTVTFSSLQEGEVITRTMMLSDISIQHLERCRAGDVPWEQIGAMTFEEM